MRVESKNKRPQTVSFNFVPVNRTFHVDGREHRIVLRSFTGRDRHAIRSYKISAFNSEDMSMFLKHVIPPSFLPREEEPEFGQSYKTHAEEASASMTQVP